MFKTYKDKKTLNVWRKINKNYENVCDETSVYEQKPIKIDNLMKLRNKR